MPAKALLARAFPYKGHTIRTLGASDAPLFVAKDVCDALTIPWNGAATLVALPEAWKLVVKLPTSFGDKDTMTITEAGVYKLAFRSNKSEAEEFTNHVASEILPSIRKTGAYLVTTDTPQNKFAVMRQMLDQLEEQEGRLQQNERAVARLDARVNLFGADTGYRTVRAFSKESGRNFPERVAKEIGRRAADLCRQRGITIGDVPDERYGSVHSYPVGVIKEAFNLQSHPLR